MLIARWTFGVLEFRFEYPLWIWRMYSFAYHLFLIILCTVHQSIANNKNDNPTWWCQNSKRKTLTRTYIYSTQDCCRCLNVFSNRIFNLHFISTFFMYFIYQFCAAIFFFFLIFIGWCFALGWAIVQMFWVHSLQITMSNIILNGGWFGFFFINIIIFLFFFSVLLCVRHSCFTNLLMRYHLKWYLLKLLHPYANW